MSRDWRVEEMDLQPRERLRLGAIGEAYRRRHGVAVEWVKAAVGDGYEFTNAAARAVVSPRGAWVECLDLDLEFSGVVGGEVPYRIIRREEAGRLLARMHRLAEEHDDRRHCALFVLYSPAGIANGRDVYATRHGAGPHVGTYRPGVLPLYFRCRTSRVEPVEGVAPGSGVVFVLALEGDLHLLATLPHDGADAVDLGSSPSGLAH